MLLEGKNAIIYGGGGNVGGAVARAFAREGARLRSEMCRFAGETCNRRTTSKARWSLVLQPLLQRVLQGPGRAFLRGWWSLFLVLRVRAALRWISALIVTAAIPEPSAATSTSSSGGELAADEL
jgi:hypothetical protein